MIAVRSKLVILVECPNSKIYYFDTGHCFLHWRMGDFTLDHNAFQQDAHMASTCFRSWIGSSSLVSGQCFIIFQCMDDSIILSDVMGNVIVGIVYTLGRISGSISWYIAMAVARCAGRYSRGWSGYDIASGKSSCRKCIKVAIFNGIIDAITSSRLCNTGIRSNHWFNLCHGR